jgi:hypothetical protein
MSVQYKAIRKPNPQKNEPGLFYIHPIQKQTIGMNRLEEAIVTETSLSKADVRGVLATLSDLLSR